ncbi:YidB family protein [Kitasatospora sp. NPDC088346]|uniref:YidB family protein n=1 Tax=Kitasatospora sp. NPDC088346 TaxID=3364073 RepID=UPI003819BA3A
MSGAGGGRTAPPPARLTEGVTVMAGNDLGSLLGGLLGGGRGAGAGNLLGALLGALGSGGGDSLSGLLQQLQEGGLGAKARSWVGTGENEAVTGAEVAQALPYQELDLVARQAGLSPEQAADQLAVALPEAVDRLTPQGEVPAGSWEDVIAQAGRR